MFVLTFSSVNHGLDGEQSNAPPPLWRRLAGMKSKWDRLRSLTATIKDQSLDYVNAGLCDGGGFTELLVGRFLTQYVTRSSCCKSNCIARYFLSILGGSGVSYFVCGRFGRNPWKQTVARKKSFPDTLSLYISQRKSHKRSNILSNHLSLSLYE